MFGALLQQFSIAFRILGYFLETFIYWAPIALVFALWNLWRSYLLKKYLSNIQWVMLEIKLPKEIKKTPLAMEMVLSALYQGGTGPWTDQLFKGRVKDWFSLELVSIDGAIHFFIRTPVGLKNLIEAQIYGQYPAAEVYEVTDYARWIDYTDVTSAWQPWGIEYELTGPDPLPIGTYIDFGLNKEGLKDEEKVDPITTMIEMFGTCGKGEQLWLQIMVQVSGDRFHVPGTRSGKQNWVKEGQRLVAEIEDKYKKTGAGDAGDMRLTAADKAKIMAINRSISKMGFDAGIRAFYWVHKDGTFDVSKIKGLVGLFRPFQLAGLNGFKPKNVTDFDYPWQDYKNRRREHVKRQMFSAYKRRSYFYPPHKRKPFVLNTEELATIYHFPGTVSETPTFGRIGSRKGEPPTNLPI